MLLFAATVDCNGREATTMLVILTTRPASCHHADDIWLFPGLRFIILLQNGYQSASHAKLRIPVKRAQLPLSKFGPRH
jgi:hypothetical protein